MKNLSFALLTCLLVSCTSSPVAVTPLPSLRPPLPPVPGVATTPILKTARVSAKPLKLRLTRFKLGGQPSVTLSWDASTDPAVTGYKIYEGSQSQTYTNMVDVGLQTSVTLTNLVANTQYYFAGTAVAVSPGHDTLESDYSLEVRYLAPAPLNYTVGVQLLVSGSPNGPWKVYATLPSVSIPNPGYTAFFQSFLTITNQ